MARLVSCSTCGRIHDSQFICEKKKQQRKEYATNRRSRKKDIRNGRRWKATSIHIRDRDLHLCQMCFRELYMNEYMTKINYTNLSVHHIIALKDREDLAYADFNLITLCEHHHKIVENNPKFIKMLMDIAKEQNEKNF